MRSYLRLFQKTRRGNFGYNESAFAEPIGEGPYSFK